MPTRRRVVVSMLFFNAPPLDPSFLGTHILDYSWALGDLISLVQTKAAAMP